MEEEMAWKVAAVGRFPCVQLTASSACKSHQHRGLSRTCRQLAVDNTDRLNVTQRQLTDVLIRLILEQLYWLRWIQQKMCCSIHSVSAGKKTLHTCATLCNPPASISQTSADYRLPCLQTRSHAGPLPWNELPECICTETDRIKL